MWNIGSGRIWALTLNKTIEDKISQTLKILLHTGNKPFQNKPALNEHIVWTHPVSMAYAANALCSLTKLPTEDLSHCSYTGKICIYICFQFVLSLTSIGISLADQVTLCHVLPVFSRLSFQLLEKGFRRGGEGHEVDTDQSPWANECQHSELKWTNTWTPM